MKLNKKQREKLKQKYFGRCAYCGCLLGDKWDADHFEPLTRISGGMLNPERDNIENLMPSCKPCNRHKFNYTIEHWRSMIEDGRREFLNSAKGKTLHRLGLVKMDMQPVSFLFERFKGFDEERMEFYREQDEMLRREND